MHHVPDHARHDLDLVAGLASDDLTAAEQLRARAQVHDCTQCAAVRDDLLAIMAATRSLPAQPAPHDFRLTPEQAATLRRTSWVSRMLGPIAGARSIARPLAATFTTLGLVGVVVAAALPGLVGARATSFSPESAGGGATPISAPAANGGGVAGPALASVGPVDGGFGAKDNAQASDIPAAVQGAGVPGSASGATTDGSTADTRTLGRVADTQPANLLLWGSITVLGVGLMLFALRFAGRRLR
ncbi:MAG TPA: hypothetical protein VHL56_08495 [Candidatus Limnocylindrales bacterium]|nr:hypothetical protein [Candidatus Limnocylindrales bacterium]